MTTGASSEQIGAAQAYEDLHVPALFGQWAPRVLDAAAVEPGQRVLDVACGTGILAREALLRVGADGSVAGVDPDAGMLAVAERLEPRVEWRAGTAASIPWPVLEAAEEALAGYVTDDGQAVCDSPAPIVTGTIPGTGSR